MSSGLLGSADLAATTNTTVYTVPSSVQVDDLTVRFTNRNATAVTVRLAICATATPGNAEYIEYGYTIQPNGVLMNSGIIVQQNKLIVAYASATGVSIAVLGNERKLA